MCKHQETVSDSGRTFCLYCGVQRVVPVARSEPPVVRETTGAHTKTQYFGKALLVLLGEEPISESDMEVIRGVAAAAEEALGRCAPKLHLKRFVLKQHRDLSAVVRKHFPKLMALNGHALPIVSSEQRRVMFRRYEQAVLNFDKSRFAKKKNISCQEVINECLREFGERGLLQQVPPPR